MHFYYNAKTREGKDETWILEAKDEQDLARILREKNLILVSIKTPEQEKIRKTPLINRLKGVLHRISLVEKLMFTRNLAVMIGAGFSLHKGLETLVSKPTIQDLKRLLPIWLKESREESHLLTVWLNIPRFSIIFS